MFQLLTNVRETHATLRNVKTLSDPALQTLAENGVGLVADLGRHGHRFHLAHIDGC